jgi:flagellin
MDVGFADWSVADANVYGTAAAETKESVVISISAGVDKTKTLTIGNLIFTANATNDVTAAQLYTALSEIPSTGIADSDALDDVNTAVTADIGEFSFASGTSFDYGFDSEGSDGTDGSEVVKLVSQKSGDQTDLTISSTSTTAVPTGVITQGIATKVDSISIHNAAGAGAAITTLDAAITGVTAEQAKYGAYLSRLQYASDNISNVATNLDQSRSRIQDADYAVETTALARTQIIAQASTAMLAQANQVKQTVLALLQ